MFWRYCFVLFPARLVILIPFEHRPTQPCGLEACSLRIGQALLGPLQLLGLRLSNGLSR